MDRYEQHAAQHMRASRARGGAQGELLRAKMFMVDRRRLRAEHEKTLRMVHLLETQIDGIMASNVDAMVVQTMRSYNSTASQLAFPALTSQLEHLSDQLSDRTHEIGALQEALNYVANVTIPEADGGGMDDASLMQELEALLLVDTTKPETTSDREPAAGIQEPSSLAVAPPVRQPEDEKGRRLPSPSSAPGVVVLPSPPQAPPSPRPPRPPPTARPSIMVVSSHSFHDEEDPAGREALPG